MPILDAMSAQQIAEVPQEYVRIQRIVDRLAKFNDLGESPISFKIIAGSHTGYLGSQAQNNEGKFHFYMGLDPFKEDYDQETMELIKQGHKKIGMGQHRLRQSMSD